MKALVTRPREDARAIAEALRERHIEVLVEPLLDIVIHRGIALPQTGVQGFLATSANGVRALAANDRRRDLPLWAVGEATAQKARALGFAAVESAGGDVDSLADLVIAKADPQAGGLVHAAGSVQAGDLAGRLGAAGFQVERAVLYEARSVDSLSSSLLAALDAGELGMALFFSPRTAATFVKLAIAAGRQGDCSKIDAYALSRAVAERLNLLAWRSVRCASHPDQAAMLAAIDGAS